MPAAVPLAIAIAPAVIGGTAAVVGAKMQSNSAKRAAAAQQHSNDAALDYQKEQDQYLRQRYELEDKREEEARAAYRQYLAANGRGPSPGTPAAAPENTSPVAMAARAAVMAPGYSAQPSVRDLAPAPASGGAPAPGPVDPGPSTVADVSSMPMPTIADTSRWNEWAPYLTQHQAS